MENARAKRTRTPAPDLPSGVRRAQDRILAAFNVACETDELEVAARLLVDYERLVTRLPITLADERRAEMDKLISAHSRLWELLRASLPQEGSSETTSEDT